MKTPTYNKLIINHLKNLKLSKKARSFIDSCDESLLIDIFDLTTTCEDVEHVSDEIEIIESNNDESINVNYQQCCCDLSLLKDMVNMKHICQIAGVSYDKYRNHIYHKSNLSHSDIYSLLQCIYLNIGRFTKKYEF